MALSRERRQDVLKPGMTFSNEPTICIYGEFGVRWKTTWSSPKPAPAVYPAGPFGRRSFGLEK